MALQPIDLQTMYSQISNAAKMTVNVEQSMSLAQKAQQEHQSQNSSHDITI